MRRLRVLKPIRSIEEVLASLDAFGGAIAERLDERRSSAEDGRSATFSYGEVFEELGRDLVSLRGDLVAAEDVHVARLARKADVRRRCEELRRELYEQQVSVRRILSGAFGSSRNFELAAISGTTPRTLKALEEQVDQTVKLLREPVDEAPPVKVVGVEVDLGKVADGLAARLEELRSARRALERARKAVGESKVLLDQVLKEVRGRFPWIARTLESYARIAGEPELAGLVRTSIRRVTRRQAEPEEEAEPASAGDAPSGEAVSSETVPEAEAAATAETSTSPAIDPPAGRGRVLLLLPAPESEDREPRSARSRT